MLDYNKQYQNNWDNKDLPKRNLDTKEKKSIIFWFMIFSFLCFCIVIIFTIYNYYFKNNYISSENIIFTHNLLTNYESGVRKKIEFEISNKNKVEIRGVELFINYESGRKPNGEYNIERQKFDLGNIGFQESIATSTYIVFTGKEGDERKFNLSINYKLNNNTVFNKTFDNKVIISSSLINLNIKSNKIEDFIVGDYVELITDITNISKEDWGGGSLEIQTPYGFVPQKDSGDSIRLSDLKNINISPLKRGEKFTYKLQGYFDGKKIGENIFRYIVSDKLNNNSLITENSISLFTINSPITYRLEYKYNSSLVDKVVTNKRYEGYLIIKNDSDYAYDNLNVSLLTAFSGNFIFDSKKYTDLKRINPGEEKTLEFAIIFPGKENIINLEIYGNKKGKQDKNLLLSEEYTVKTE